MDTKALRLTLRYTESLYRKTRMMNPHLFCLNALKRKKND